MRELDAWAIMHVGSKEANELFDIVGRAIALERERCAKIMEDAMDERYCIEEDARHIVASMREGKR